MTEAGVAARLDALWESGVFRGDGAELNTLAAANPAHPRADELRAFADIAVLLEGEFGRLRPPGAYPVDPATPAPARALGHAAAAWRAAVTADLQRAEISCARAREALDEEGDPRLATAAAYTDLAEAELHYFGGDHARARGALKAAATRRESAPAPRLAARGRLALIIGRHDPALGVTALDGVARSARRLGQPVEVLHAQLTAAMTLLNAGALADARRRLAEMVRTPPPAHAIRYATMARLLLSVLSDTDTDGAIRQVSEGIRLAATDGDTFAYILLVGLATRLYVERGAPADALLTVTAGIQQLAARGGEELALPLVGEREALRNELGVQAWAEAIEAAHARLDRGTV